MGGVVGEGGVEWLEGGGVANVLLLPLLAGWLCCEAELWRLLCLLLSLPLSRRLDLSERSLSLSLSFFLLLLLELLLDEGSGEP